jgi:large exoprotein involved in heme utilization and adhesion
MVSILNLMNLDLSQYLTLRKKIADCKYRFSAINGGWLSASTHSAGLGGNISIEASESIEFLGTDTEINPSVGYYFPSSIYVSSQPGSSGDSGNLVINTNKLIVGDGGYVSVDSHTGGSGGNLTIQANDSIEIFGTDITGFPTLLSGSTRSQGNAGSINIKTNNLIVRDEGGINFSSEYFTNGIFETQDAGKSGNLNIIADRILLNNNAFLSANIFDGSGSNIDLTSNSIIIANNSQITTNATGDATGGNVNINTNNLVSLGESSITANSTNSFGGKIFIDTQGQFISPDSNITAFGKTPQFDGIVQINTPDVDPNSGLVQLSNNVVQASETIVTSCNNIDGNGLTVRNKDNLPNSPISLQTGSTIWQDLRDDLITNRDSVEITSREKQYPIIEARGLTKQEDGTIVLIGDNAGNSFNLSQLNCP